MPASQTHQSFTSEMLFLHTIYTFCLECLHPASEPPLLCPSGLSFMITSGLFWPTLRPCFKPSPPFTHSQRLPVLWLGETHFTSQSLRSPMDMCPFYRATQDGGFWWHSSQFSFSCLTEVCLSHWNGAPWTQEPCLPVHLAPSSAQHSMWQELCTFCSIHAEE